MPSLIWRLSAAVGAPFSMQQLLRHAPIHARGGGQIEGGEQLGRVHCAVLRQHHEEGHHLEVVDPGELALAARVCRRARTGSPRRAPRSCRRRRPRRRRAVAARAHVLALLRGLVEAGAGAGVGQVAADAEALQPVEDLLGLGVGQQHGAVVADVHEVVRRERIAAVGGALGRVALGAQAEDDAGRDLGLARSS